MYKIRGPILLSIRMSLKKLVVFIELIVWLPAIQALCSVNISSMECQPSKSVCSETLCNYTLANQFSLTIHEVRCILAQDILYPSLRVKHEIKVGSKNKYRPGMFNHQISICELATGFNLPVLNLFISKEKLDNIIHPCPYKKKEVISIQEIAFETKNVPIAHQPGEYRVTFSVTKGKFAQVNAIVIYGHRCVNID